VSLGAAGRQRQHGIQSVERLNRRFLVDREDHRVIGRIHVQADHLRGSGFEVGIGM
jgi:hypothetical protein